MVRVPMMKEGTMSKSKTFVKGSIVRSRVTARFFVAGATYKVVDVSMVDTSYGPYPEYILERVDEYEPHRVVRNIERNFEEVV